MQYRIVEISKRLNFDFNVSSTWDDVKKWYVIEYRDEKSFLSNSWKRLKYNMEKILHYGDYDGSYGSYHPTITDYDGAWQVGPYIPTLKMAKQLLSDFLEHEKQLEKQREEQNQPDKVVFANYNIDDSTNECTKLLNEFQDFLALNEKTN